MRCAWCDNERPDLLERTAAGDVFCLVCSHVTPPGLAGADRDHPERERIRPMRRICGLFMLGVWLASVAGAQTVYNPTRVVFDSPDHEVMVTSYVIEYWLPTVDPATGAPVTTGTLAKAVVTTNPTPPGAYQALLSAITPLPAVPVGTTYVARLKAIGAGGESVRSSASNPFAFQAAPRPPAAVSTR